MSSITNSRCPACGHEDLEIAIDPSTAAAGEQWGEIRCRNPKCPRPDAVAEILRDVETNHIVVIGEENFSLKHPLIERLEDELFECPVHRWLNAQHSQDSLGVDPGRYRLIDEGDLAAGYFFEPLEGVSD